MWARIALRQLVPSGSSKLHILNNARSSPFLPHCLLSSEAGESRWVKLNPTQEQPYTLTDWQVQEITKGDPEKELKLKELLLKLFIKHEVGTELPGTIRLDSFEVMLDCGSNQLTRKIRYLVKNCKSDVKLLKEKEENNQRLQAHREQRAESETFMDYSLNRNCLFLQLFKRSWTAAYNVNALHGLQFGQKLVFDCSLESYMFDRELKHTAKQILLSYDNGRRERRPFSIHLCSLDPNGKLMQVLIRQRPDLLDLPIGIHEDSYMNLFEMKNLVYIDQRAHQKLVYNPKDIIILRAVVDRPGAAPRGDKKALKEKIRCAALPLDNYVVWKPKVQKHLCLDHFHDILLHVKNNRSWPKALEAHMPKSRYESIRTSEAPRRGKYINKHS